MGSNKKHYAVIRGFRPGIYNAWFGPGGAEEQVKGYENALFKGFVTLDAAEKWIQTVSPIITAKTEVISRFAGKPPESPDSPATAKKEAPATANPGGSSGKVSSPSKIVIYTDGGCRRNPGPGGYGAVILHGKRCQELSGGFRLTTNNRMELAACTFALRSLEFPSEVDLHSDSQYVVKGIEKGWAKRWRKNGWMRTPEEAALNADLWAELLELCERHRVRFFWVRGHAGNRENERCDQLATEAALKRDLAEDSGYLRQQARKRDYE
jgi:ribonuclease HI